MRLPGWNANQIINYAEAEGYSRKRLMDNLADNGYACQFCHRLLAAGVECPLANHPSHKGLSNG